MADYSLRSDGGTGTDEGTGQAASSIGVSITNSGVAHTKTSWTQLVASTTRQCVGLLITVSPGSLVASSTFLLDIGIGAAASEVAIVPNILLSNGTGRDLQFGAFIPIQIPAGTRIAGRFQSSSTTVALRITVELVAGGFNGAEPYQRIEDAGTATASSTGTTVDPGGVANTKGSWTQIIAATTFPYREMLLCLGSGVQATRPNAGWLIDIGVGAGGSEAVQLANIGAGVESGTINIYPRVIGPIPCAIPTGTRISARCQCSSITAAQRAFDLIVYGIG